ncbi:unnamed protein product [Caenorhabditis auriculariae]|uniref:Uncharacterized protein n=1 Tax=Caenorhabditis auriculariae TaxID=2777116 RepID=A0A8S1GWB3_9PELO|nr:unnamed protein product [Caenorhabditis auriculariae]
MHSNRPDLLSIEPSASKPSLLSSYWSLNVQVQNNERLDLDVKGSSQMSLPEAHVDEQPTQLRTTRSLTDISGNCEREEDFEEQTKTQPPPQTKDNASCRVADWLTKLNVSK